MSQKPIFRQACAKIITQLYRGEGSPKFTIILHWGNGLGDLRDSEFVKVIEEYPCYHWTAFAVLATLSLSKSGLMSINTRRSIQKNLFTMIQSYDRPPFRALRKGLSFGYHP